MKKMLPLFLALSVLFTVVFSSMGFASAQSDNTADALFESATLSADAVQSTDTIYHSMLPASADLFQTMEGGDGTISVFAEEDGYRFASERGWPSAYYSDEDNWFYVNESDNVFFHYDIEVVSGTASVLVYFAGQKPNEMASPGSFVCVNGLVDPSYVDPITGDALMDLPVGTYEGMAPLSALGYSEAYVDSNGEMLISGFKVFAVGGEVIIRNLSFSGSKAVVTTTTDSATTTTTTTSTTRATGTHGGITYSGHSLLPSDAAEFQTQSGGNFAVSVTAEGSGYRFSSEGGWPSAYYTAVENQLYVHEDDDLYLYYDVEVLSGATNVIVYFAGQSATGEATPGSFVSVNGLVNPTYVDPVTGGAIVDLTPGRYTGAVPVSELGYREDLKNEGYMLISGCKVFAVGGDTVVHNLLIGEKQETTTSSSAISTTTTGVVKDRYSLLPESVEQYVTMSGGDGTISVTQAESGHRFVSDRGWPSAYYHEETDWVRVSDSEDAYFNFDIEVTSGSAAIYVYFAGTHPTEQAGKGSFVAVNGLIDPSYVGSDGHVMIDIPAGTYQGHVPLSELVYNDELKDEHGNLCFSGCKIFAVGGEVVVHELSITTHTPLGDLSGDNKVNIADSMLLFASASGRRALTAEQQKAADLSGDGKVNIVDSMLLFKTVSGR